MDSFQYIPVEDTLKKLLKLPDIIHEINNFHGSSSNILSDMCDGSLFNAHPVFKLDKCAIHVIAYYDEVELCNPLGSNIKNISWAAYSFQSAIFVQSFVQG